MGQSNTEFIMLKRNPKWEFRLSILITVLLTGMSVYGLLNPEEVYRSAEYTMAFVPNDQVNLFIGLPLLAVVLFFVKRKNLLAYLCWPGALFFVLYNYSIYLLANPFGIMFLPYLLIVSLAVYTLISLISTFDFSQCKAVLENRIPARVSGGILAALALMIFLREIGLIIGTLSGAQAVSALDSALWMSDFLIGAPPLLIIGVLLWQRKAMGYAGAAGLLLQYGLLCVGLVPVMVYQANVGQVPVDTAGIVVVLFMSLLCLVPFAFFAKATWNRKA